MVETVMQVVEHVRVPQPPSIPQAPHAPQVPEVATTPGGTRVEKSDDGTFTITGADGSKTVITKDGITTIGPDGSTSHTGTGIPPLPFTPGIPSQAVDISLAFFLMVAFIAVGTPLARAFARRMDRKAVAPAPAHDDERLSRIEQSLEAVALEVERIGEGQRYVTQLMSNRGDALRVGGGGQ